MRSDGIRASPNPITGVLARRGTLGHTEGGPFEDSKEHPVMGVALCKPRTTKDSWQPPESRKKQQVGFLCALTSRSRVPCYSCPSKCTEAG